LATFAGWNSLSDLALKRSLGIDPGETDESRSDAIKRLHDALRYHGIHSDSLYAVAHYLARTRSRLLALSLEDLLQVTDQPNIPGTVDEHPNWRQRLPVGIEGIVTAIDVPALRRATAERQLNSVA
jgi:4-alpha-glucanotransferase